MAGLYLHVPFRLGPRPYDEHPATTDLHRRGAYLRAVRLELAQLARAYPAPLRTLYIGGGRPSLLQASSCARLLEIIHQHFDTGGLTEVTFECSPADATPDYLAALAGSGVNRLSFDALAFTAADLDAAEAPHTARQAADAVRHARSAGVDNLNVDLLFGSPGHSARAWQNTLRAALALDAPHLTLIEWTSDDGSSPSATDPADLYRTAMDTLQDAGYEHYEISHFARPGWRGQHTPRYWDHTDVLGAGPAAHSFWWPDRDAPHTTATRWANVHNLNRYVALLNQRHQPVATRTTLSRAALAAEYVALRLRTADGLDLDHLHAQYGVDLRAEHGDTIDRLRALNYLTMDGTVLRLTDDGTLVCDTVTERLLPVSSPSAS